MGFYIMLNEALNFDNKHYQNLSLFKGFKHNFWLLIYVAFCDDIDRDERRIQRCIKQSMLESF